MEKEVTKERIEAFLNGYNPMEHITNIECGYNDDKVSIIFDGKDGHRKIKQDDFKPFCWVKRSACIRMYNGDRSKLKWALNKAGIRIKELRSKDENGNEADRLKNGYKFLFYSTVRMSYSEFMHFFQYAGTPIYSKNRNENTQEKEFLTCSPVEQYMISTGTRLFKGYENYDDVKRLVFDLETGSLNPRVSRITLNGVRTNKGFETVLEVKGNTKEEKDESELQCIRNFLKIIFIEQPSIIIGYNSENFDWNFLFTRLEELGSSMEEETKKLFPHPIYKKNKQTILKLGGEMEYYYPTIFWGYSIIDGLHAVRRAQAIDSNIKSANLKYMTKYAELNKRNRVYISGDKINALWSETDEKEYAFNDKNGDWYKIDENHPLKEDYVCKSGNYIVKRYNLDDIWETDKVELRFNESNFLLGKLLPTTFQRASTMGTAGTWKLIMLAWSFENELAIPSFSINRRFVGGLSRLLKVGYVDRIVKLDYNSLYPSIMLTWKVKTPLDVTNAMLSFLRYILSEREKFKGLKKKAGKEADKIETKIKEKVKNGEIKEDSEEYLKLKDEKKHWDSEENANDKKQLPFKIFGNSFFGGYGSPGVYPWGDLICAEKTTCIGRQSLRLMISWFKNRGYTPIVGDSFNGDTPIFIKYNDNNMIDIKPISEIIDENEINIDALGREYDYSEKSYKVLCRSGWSEPKYIYRHKTDKDIYEVTDSDNKVQIEVTEDHSLYDDKQNKISPKDINQSDTKLEYYKNEIGEFGKDCENVYDIAKDFNNGKIDRIPIEILNGSYNTICNFLKYLNSNKNKSKVNWTKTNIAAINYLINKISKHIN